MPTVHLANDKSFTAATGLCILDAARSAGLVLEHSCRTGRCGACKAKVLEGSVCALKADLYLSEAERRAGWALTCVNAANTDLRLDVDHLGRVAELAIKTVPCRINAIERPVEGVAIVRLRLPPRTAFDYLAGQYIDVIGPGGVRRSYSIANPPDGSDRLELHVRRVDGGAMSRYWFDEAKVNDLLRLRGPLGTFFMRDVAGLHLVLLATGTGISPMRAMLAELALRPGGEQPSSIYLYWGNRAANDAYLGEAAFGTDQSAVPVRFTPVLSRADSAWSGARGHVQDVLMDERPVLSNAAVYACGSPAMIDSARATLAAAGLPAGRFLADAFVPSA